jgi:hypothetical protein
MGATGAQSGQEPPSEGQKKCRPKGLGGMLGGIVRGGGGC